MMNSEIFHLVFNDFKTKISSNWTDLRDESQFCDVTLACEGSRVEAHKVILSACSPVIKDILLQTHHQHPLLYLRGVRRSQIMALLDFIYKGEVNIAQEELNDFLEVAKELKVKGLAEEENQVNQNKGYSANANDKPEEKAGNSLTSNHPPPEQIKPKFPPLYSPIAPEESEIINSKQKPYYAPHVQQESTYEPHIKMEEQDYYEGEDGSYDGEAFYSPMKYKCEFCDEIVSRNGDDYRNHLRLVHDVRVKEKRDLGCPECFERKEDYMDVKRCQRKHKKDKFWKLPTEFQCNDVDCGGVVFKQKKAFLQHLRRHHRMDFKPTVKPDHWVCIYCEKLSASDKALKHHEDICPKNPANVGRNCKRGRKPRTEVAEVNEHAEPRPREAENAAFGGQGSGESRDSSSGMVYPSD